MSRMILPSLLFSLIVSGTFNSISSAETPYGKVDLLRDSWGIPHIYADTDEGAFYGLGYAAAEDRGFQMYYFLRIIQGRTSEFLGEMEKKNARGNIRTTLDHDRLMRTIGFHRAAQETAKNLDAESIQLLKAYSQGVNDYFKENEAHEHYLFEKTGLKRDPWTPADCLLSWWHFAKFFAKDGLNDFPGLSMPPPRGGRFMPKVQVDDDAAVVQREDVSEDWIKKVDAWVKKMGLASPEKGAKKNPDSPDPKFSHAWVVGGNKTTTGSAVLVSDPQTPVWNPNMLYEFHAKGKTFNARGIGVSGSPIILIGFNTHVAWGLTALGADQADIFLLATDSLDHPNQYQVDGEWIDMEVYREVIQVKDQDPVHLKVRETAFGPVVSKYVRRNQRNLEFALRRVPICESKTETIQGAIAMMRARSSEEFAKALPKWRFPTANCVFGDSKGKIGYWSLGALPVRSMLTQGNGQHAQDGRTLDGMWRGMIPYQYLPHTLDPKRGYLVTANHRTIQSFYKVPFGNMTGSSGDTDRGLRIKERILEHLKNNKQFKPEDVLSIHYDSVNVWKREVVRLGFKILKSEPKSLFGEAQRALNHLQSWYQEGAQSTLSIPGTELVNEMRAIFRGNNFKIVSRYGGGVSGLARFAKTVSQRDAMNPKTKVNAEEREFVNMVLTQAWNTCQGKYGPDPKTWNSKAKKIQTQQVLGYMESLDGFPALDEDQKVKLPLLGTTDGSTVISQKHQSYTQYVPLHDPDQALTILPFGNSDNPKSPFRFSTYGDWAQGKLHPAPLSRSAVEKYLVSQITIGEKLRSFTRNGRSGRTGSDRTAPQPRQGSTQRKPLPGIAPTDFTLQSAIRYMNRKERTEEEVKTKLQEIKDYVGKDAALNKELKGGLVRFIYIMKESQAGRIRIQYGTPKTLKLVEAFYKQLTGK